MGTGEGGPQGDRGESREQRCRLQPELQVSSHDPAGPCPLASPRREGRSKRDRRERKEERDREATCSQWKVGVAALRSLLGKARGSLLVSEDPVKTSRDKETSYSSS